MEARTRRKLNKVSSP